MVHGSKSYSDIELLKVENGGGSYLKCITQQDGSLVCGSYYKDSHSFGYNLAFALIFIAVIFILFFGTLALICREK